MTDYRTEKKASKIVEKKIEIKKKKKNLENLLLKRWLKINKQKNQPKIKFKKLSKKRKQSLILWNSSIGK